MWDKSKLFHQDAPQYKDPTITPVKPIVIHPKDNEPLYIPPKPVPRQRTRTFWTPPDHSLCTSQWCAYAIGNKAASWSEYAIIQKQTHENALAEERKRKDPNNYEPYK